MGIIFDLDQTLIDSSIAEPYRKKASFKDVYPLIPSFAAYEGMAEVLDYIKRNEIPTCIVTSSPSVYCDKVINHWGINVDFKVCYHDTPKRKPFPDPILKAIDKLKVTDNRILSIGDRDVDIIASNKAKVVSVACLWGNTDNTSLLSANPTYIVSRPIELIEIIRVFFGIVY